MHAMSGTIHPMNYTGLQKYELSISGQMPKHVLEASDIPPDAGELLPTKGFAASDFVYRTWHPDEWSYCRKRMEWRDKVDRKESGEIRNITVLGIIGESLVVAYQGQGTVCTFIDNRSS